MSTILRGSDNFETDDVQQLETYVNNKPSGFKNLLINGGFDVWQRGTSQSTQGYGSADRWFHMIESPCTSTLSLDTTGNKKRAKMVVVGGASGQASLWQNIENISMFNNKTVTFSLTVNSSAAVTMVIWFDYVYSGSADVIQHTKTVNLVAGDNYITHTITTKDISSKSIDINSFFRVGFTIANVTVGAPINQSATLLFDNVQLEEGSVATPFEQRPYGLELSLCRRYFYNYVSNLGRTAPFNEESNGATGASSAGGNIAFRLTKMHPVAMRTVPSVSYSGLIKIFNGAEVRLVTSVNYNNCSSTVYSVDWNVASAFTVTSGCIELLPQGTSISVSAEL